MMMDVATYDLVNYFCTPIYLLLKESPIPSARAASIPQSISAFPGARGGGPEGRGTGNAFGDRRCCRTADAVRVMGDG